MRDLHSIQTELSVLNDELCRCLVRVGDLQNEIARAALWKVEPEVAPKYRDAVSRGVPDGFDTVLGYLAKNHTEILELMDWRDPEATVRDSFWLAHRFKEKLYVPACEALRMRGILRVRAYPVALLAQRFGG